MDLDWTDEINPKCWLSMEFDSSFSLFAIEEVLVDNILNGSPDVLGDELAIVHTGEHSIAQKHVD